MASPFTEALTASMVQGLDPMNSIMRRFAEQNVAGIEVQHIEQKAESISKIERLLSEAKDRDADSSVIGSYQKLLAQLTS